MILTHTRNRVFVYTYIFVQDTSYTVLMLSCGVFILLKDAMEVDVVSGVGW